MPFDAVFLTATLQELAPIIGGRIDKIQQPERDKIILSLRGSAGNCKLLLCARPGSARLHLTQTAYENPASPPMFCMLLRKHLTGARITALTQPSMERIAILELSTRNELGERAPKRLILEMLGRYANIILTDEDGTVIDALRRVDEEMSRTRRVLPGLRYELPPIQEKANPLTVTAAELANAFHAAADDARIDKWALDTFFGLSPLVCREMAERGTGRTDCRKHELDTDGQARFLDVLGDVLSQIRAGQFTPCVLLEGDVPFDFSYLPITQYGGSMTAVESASFSDALELFYSSRDRDERLKQRAGALVKQLTKLRDRLARKLSSQREELAGAADRDRKRELGDIITANLHRMQKGADLLVAEDFYAPDGGKVSIKLDPLKTPQQNAAGYYKGYNKLKSAEKYLTEQIEKAKGELEYVESVLESIGKADTQADIGEIRSELRTTGILREGRKKEREIPAKLMTFRAEDGTEIIAGKNNLQNDRLTFKIAHRSDIWLHVQRIHGSHVIIRCAGETPSQQTLEDAAVIAASFSEAGEGQKVPVDYTAVRNVKRKPGGRPGMVFYTDFQTIYVGRDSGRASRLRKE